MIDQTMNSQTMSLREKKKQAVRCRLYNTAISMFRERGFDDVSVNDIVEAAGVAKGTFFNHFPTKAHVLADWYADFLSYPEPTPGMTLAAALRSIVISKYKQVTEDPGIFSAKIANDTGNPLLQNIERESDVELAASLARVLRQDPAVCLPPELQDGQAVAELIVTLLTGISREWRMNRDRSSLVALGEKRLGTMVAVLTQAAGEALIAAAAPAAGAGDPAVLSEGLK